MRGRMKGGVVKGTSYTQVCGGNKEGSQASPARPSGNSSLK